MLWVWESPQDLRMLSPNRAGVAFLAASLFLEGDRIRFRPRLQPLRVSRGTFLMAVVRLETSPVEAASYSENQRRELVKSIREIVTATRAKALQIDFDAKQSERAFYRALIPEVRAALGPRVFLSITALVSWCQQDNWLEHLGANEAVPMAFRMGSDGPVVRSRLLAGSKFPALLCRSSIGVAMDEPRPPLAGYHRIYAFPGPASWTSDLVAQLLREVEK